MDVAGRAIELRPERPEDHEFLLQLYGSTRAEELRPVPWSEDEKARFLRFQFDAQHRFYRENYPRATFEVIEAAGEPIGRLYVEEWSREIRLIDIALVAAWRGTGIGTALLRSLQERARSSGKSLSVHVERLNPALRLYQRLGFATMEDKGVYLLLAWLPAELEPEVSSGYRAEP